MGQRFGWGDVHIKQRPRTTRHLKSLNAIRVMLLIRLAIGIFALTLLGLAFSLNSAQSQQENQFAETTILSHQ